MKKQHLVLALAAAAAFGASGLVVGQSAAAPAPAGGLTILEFKPAFDDMMTMLVQPRHIKLWAAGQQKNWELAGFQLNELRAALRRVGQTIPMYRTYNVDMSVASIFTPAVQKMDAAIKAKDAAQFTAAYGELTTACNTCHQGMDHPFLVIKVPDANAIQPFTNQDFAPAKK
jgi:hypothetical protein